MGSTYSALITLFVILHKTASQGHEGLVTILQDLPTNVSRIILSRNSLTIIPDTAFTPFTQLSHLDLSNNKLSNISPSAFLGNIIRYLDLSYNQLQSFPKLQSIGQTLNTLKVDGNMITELNQEDFVGLTNLINVSFHYNKITKVGSEVFTSCRQLGMLDLTYNELTEVSQTAFAGTSVHTLLLHHNQLTRSPNLWHVGSTLSKLALDFNHIQHLQSQDLYGMRRLMELNLNGNNLGTIQSGTFLHCPALYKLHLGQNDIVEVSSSAFNHTAIRELYLVGNKLQRIPSLESIRSTLVYLDVSHNPLETETSGAILDTLRTLHRIKSFDINHAGMVTFPDVRKLDKVFDRLEILSPKSHNPGSLVCNCSLVWAKDWQYFVAEEGDFDLRSTTRPCDAPDHLKEVMWQDISIQQLCPDLPGPTTMLTYNVWPLSSVTSDLDELTITADHFFRFFPVALWLGDTRLPLAISNVTENKISISLSSVEFSDTSDPLPVSVEYFNNVRVSTGYSFSLLLPESPTVTLTQPLSSEWVPTPGVATTAGGTDWEIGGSAPETMYTGSPGTLHTGGRDSPCAWCLPVGCVLGLLGLLTLGLGLYCTLRWHREGIHRQKFVDKVGYVANTEAHKSHVIMTDFSNLI